MDSDATTIRQMGANLTAGILGGALGVVVMSGVLAVQVLGEPSIGRGDVAAARYAQARAHEVARWLDPPDDKKYSGTQLVAALLAARASQGAAAIPLALPPEASGDLVAIPVAWSGTTASTAGARVTVRIEADVLIRSERLFSRGREIDGHAARCFIYTMRTGEVSAVRKLQCPAADAAMKPPEPKALST
jgi:hypothetical protein